MDEARKYLDALYRARQAYGTGAYDDATIEMVFPELAKKKEDCWYIDELQGFLDTFGEDYFGKGEWQRFYAWLDKQRELKESLSERFRPDFPAVADFIENVDELEKEQEQPEVDLEEAVEKHINEALYKWCYDDEDGIEQYVYDAFLAGAEWQKKREKRK